jgi:predicted nucleic acid-binding protein
VTDVVLDASVFVAAISPREVHHEAARRLYDLHAADRAFVVPALFRVEVLAALARRGEPTELLDTVDVLVSGPRFYAVALDASLLERATQVARTARLRAYDAVYLALALSRNAALLTLDSEVRSKTAESFPQVDLVASAT